MIRLAIRVPRERAELVLAELVDLAPGGGVEERDAGELVEYAVYGPPGELPDLPELRAAAGDALVEVSTQELPDDWHERWRDFHRPLELDGRLRVRPPWEPARPWPGEIDLVIDPAQAFGTGAHATTRLCLELLLELTPTGALADLGCGTGVLAIAAAKLGFAPVLAIDHERESVEATRANAAANGVALEVARLDVRTESAPPVPTLLANLLRPLLLDVARQLTAVPDALIASGLLTYEVDEIVAAFAPHGLVESRRRAGGDWAAVLLQRRSSDSP